MDYILRGMRMDRRNGKELTRMEQKMRVGNIGIVMVKRKLPLLPVQVRLHMLIVTMGEII